MSPCRHAKAVPYEYQVSIGVVASDITRYCIYSSSSMWEIWGKVAFPQSTVSSILLRVARLIIQYCVEGASLNRQPEQPCVKATAVPLCGDTYPYLWLHWQYPPPSNTHDCYLFAWRYRLEIAVGLSVKWTLKNERRKACSLERIAHKI